MSAPVSKTFTVFKGSESGAIVESQTTRTVGPEQVLVRITHSGLCGTDCHVKHLDQGLGHEGVGIVEAVGSATKRLKAGDVVGWGYVHDTCGLCQQCLSGNETFCHDRQMYQFANLDQGSLGTHAVWLERFLFLLPSGLSPAHAAPLMCGGATVFTPLFTMGVKATDTVGVVGIGGLGHLAIQFAAKMGCRVVVFSSTDSKRAEAMALGATEFYATRGKTTLDVKHRVNVLLTTTSQQPDWGMMLGVMEMQGKVFPLGLSHGDLNMPYAPIIAHGLSIVGCVVATRYVHNEMLKFAARHDVKPIIEEFPMSVEGIEAAYDKLENGHIRYRAVLKN
ncbi:chaperonin 10-like protein [Geopyxis carbonaria]|nr:chaperonin 10-like protein [Geopyxis carbonaria]